MGKIIQAAIIVLVFLGSLNTYGQIVGLRIPDTTSFAGDTIEIPVYVDDDLTGLNVLSFQLEISFTAACLEPLAALPAGTMSAGWDPVEYKTWTPGKITIAAAGSTPLSGKGVLIMIRFRCIKAAYSGISFSGTENNLFNEGIPELVLDNGSINIQPKPVITVRPDVGLLTSGDNLQFSVQGGTPPFQWSVTVDSVASVNSSGLLTAGERGFTRVIAEDATGIIDTTNSFVEVRGLRLSIPDTSGWQGNLISIPVYSSDVGELDIISGVFTITFNQQAILHATGISKTGTLLESCDNLTLNTNVPGQVSISFALTEPLTGSGPLIHISFMASHGAGGTYLDFGETLFNEDILSYNQKGYFTLKPLPDLTIVPDAGILLTGQTLSLAASGGFEPYTWSTTNSSIAEIDAGGELTAKQGGIVFVSVSDIIGASGRSDTIYIYDVQVNIPDTLGELKGTFDLPVYVSDLPPGVIVYSVEAIFSCQTPELEFLDIITSGALTEGWSMVSNFNNDTVRTAGASATGFTDAGTLFYIRYRLTEEFTVTETIPVNIIHFLLNEGSPNALTGDGSITGVVYGEDLSLVCVTNLSDACELPVPISYELQITNAGGITYHTDDTIRAGLVIPGEPLIPLYYVLSEDLPPAGILTFPFLDTIDQPFTGTFAYTLFTELDIDIDHGNDTVKQSFTIYGYPEVDLGDNVIEVASLPYLLDAGEGFDSYLWQDASTDQTLSASTYDMYWVRVSLHGCAGSDTVNLILVGLENQDSFTDQLKIHPNPNNGSFRLSLNGVHGETRIQIFNLLGEQVYDQLISASGAHTESITLDKPEKGVYILKTGSNLRKMVIY